MAPHMFFDKVRTESLAAMIKVFNNYQQLFQRTFSEFEQHIYFYD